MPAPRSRKHILVPTPPSAEAYTPHQRVIKLPPYAGPPDRQRHAAALREALTEAEREAEADRTAIGIAVHGAQPGLYVEFESPPGVELKLESLEDRRRGIEMVAVRRVAMRSDEPAVQVATVFVPDGALKHFFDRFQQYAEERTGKGEPRHKDMVDRIAALRRATLRALWTDAIEAYPAHAEAIWWEVWLRRHDGNELQRLLVFAAQAGIDVGERRLGFDDRIVILVRGTSAQLSASLDVLNDLAEVRKAKESSAFFVDVSAEEQAEWLNDLKQRVILPAEDSPAVCILDTGVTRAHPLLEDLIAPADAMAVDPTWGGHDDGGGSGNMGHGTEMAGLAAYGNLVPHLASGAPVHMRHRLESVKILPPRGANPPDLYGAITAQAVTRPEISAPQRPRVFSMAVTATDERDRGQPTSWSAAIDALAAGRAFDPATQGLVYLDEHEEGAQRLFIVSAGNVAPDDLQHDHLGRSDVEAVHDPAHAWNALTVGAFTEKSTIGDPAWNGWSPVAPPGDLSPWSTTSVTFQDPWPIKPDVVCEGGNVVTDGKAFENAVPDLCLLSTYYKPLQKAFVLSWATSAATAQVARMAGIIRADYPEYWPETVRALLVHSAQWTRAMQSRLRGAGGKRARAKLVRRYGFGVPQLDRALRSANDALTLIAQATIRPFSEGKMREMHIHELPWPKDALEGLGQTPVRLRVTLSYFVEPNPGRRGWKKRHRYASHGLRFDLKAPTETIDEFRKRINQRALDEEEDKPDAGGAATAWFLGEVARNKGSIHSDIWVGTAADLAERGIVGIYPVSGWWKDQPKRDRSGIGARYALVVAIETEAQDVDIWTPVALQIGIPVEEEAVDV
ncbi:MAG: S8 family peptidase [Defluviicoccus sp.]|nr:S8 family peptidase [Defluviicoccus sp.]